MPATPTAPAAPAPVAVNLPNGNVSADPQTGITANQFALQPGETAAAYTTRIAGLRAAAGQPDTSANPTDITSAEDKIAQSLGYNSYDDAQKQLTAPGQSDTDLYNSAYSAAGLDDLNNKIVSRQSDLNNATGNINDNPWLDEASRVGRVKTLTDMANVDIKNLQTEYNTKLKSVQDLVTRESTDNKTTAAANAKKLSDLESQAKTLAASNTTAAKSAAAAPKTIKGGATGATYQWNPTTQQFDQILPGKTTTTGGAKTPVPAASTTGTGPQFSGFNFTAKQLGDLNAKGLNQSDANNILTDIKAGQTLDNIRQQMTAGGLDPSLLDTIMLYVDPAHNTPPPKTSSSSGGRTV